MPPAITHRKKNRGAIRIALPESFFGMETNAQQFKQIPAAPQ